MPLELFNNDGTMRPFRTNGMFLWVVDDPGTISLHGASLSMVIPDGAEDGYEIPRAMRERIGKILAAAPAMYNYVRKLAEKGDQEAISLLMRILKEG